jgi:hypothetical protein
MLLVTEDPPEEQAVNRGAGTMIDTTIVTNASGPAKAAPQAPAPAAKAEESVKADVKVAVVTTPLSPRLKYDAVSGVVITEFLDGRGSVASQAPSAAVMAYLRVGLNADGRDEKDESVPSGGSV